MTRLLKDNQCLAQCLRNSPEPLSPGDGSELVYTVSWSLRLSACLLFTKKKKFFTEMLIVFSGIQYVLFSLHQHQLIHLKVFFWLDLLFRRKSL